MRAISGNRFGFVTGIIRTNSYSRRNILSNSPVRTNPKPNNFLTVKHTNSTIIDADSHGINGIGPVYLLKPEARMIRIPAEKSVGLSGLASNIFGQLQEHLTKTFCRFRNHIRFGSNSSV